MQHTSLAFVFAYSPTVALPATDGPITRAVSSAYIVLFEQFEAVSPAISVGAFVAD